MEIKPNFDVIDYVVEIPPRPRCMKIKTAEEILEEVKRQATRKEIAMKKLIYEPGAEERLERNTCLWPR